MFSIATAFPVNTKRRTKMEPTFRVQCYIHRTTNLHLFQLSTLHRLPKASIAHSVTLNSEGRCNISCSKYAAELFYMNRDDRASRVHLYADEIVLMPNLSCGTSGTVGACSCNRHVGFHHFRWRSDDSLDLPVEVCKLKECKLPTVHWWPADHVAWQTSRWFDNWWRIEVVRLSL